MRPDARNLFMLHMFCVFCQKIINFNISRVSAFRATQWIMHRPTEPGNCKPESCLAIARGVLTYIRRVEKNRAVNQSRNTHTHTQGCQLTIATGSRHPLLVSQDWDAEWNLHWVAPARVRGLLANPPPGSWYIYTMHLADAGRSEGGSGFVEENEKASITAAAHLGVTDGRADGRKQPSDTDPPPNSPAGPGIPCGPPSLRRLSSSILTPMIILFICSDGICACRATHCMFKPWVGKP